MLLYLVFLDIILQIILKSQYMAAILINFLCNSFPER